MSTPTTTVQMVAPAGAAAVVEDDPSKHWTRHGPVLTACLVGINLLMVLLVFFYFWRFFSGKRGPPTSSTSTMAGGGGDDEEEEGASSSSSADTSPGRHHQDREDIASSLPVFVYSSSAAAPDAGGNGKAAAAAAECAVCIVEFRDGDRARLLPRCGHRFHADCVGAWLQLHSTCPLCRAAVLLHPAAAEPAKNDQPKDDDCPV